MQIGNAFQNVVTTMSWFIFSYRNLVTLAAAAGRLDHFLTAAAQAASLGTRRCSGWVRTGCASRGCA